MFKLSQIKGSELIGFIGSGVLLGSLWLPWFSTSCDAHGQPPGCNPHSAINGMRGSFNAFQTYSVLRWLLVAAAVIVIVPWTIRNAVSLHSFIPISDETGITLVGTYNATSAADHQVPYKWRIFAAIPSDRRLAADVARVSEPALDARLRDQAFAYIGDHPLAPLEVAFHNTLRLFELEGSFAWRASAAAIGLNTGTARIGVYSFWLLCLLALLGAFTAAARSAPRWVWLVPLLLALSVVLVNVETPRFRAPVDPFLVLLAACALVSWSRGAGLLRG